MVGNGDVDACTDLHTVEELDVDVGTHEQDTDVGRVASGGDDVECDICSELDVGLDAQRDGQHRDGGNVEGESTASTRRSMQRTKEHKAMKTLP